MQDIFKIIPAKEFRNTDNVQFHFLPVFENLKGIDLVRHKPNATSPGAVGSVERPWYMHPHQTDNLIVFQGKRIVDLYSEEHGRPEVFEVTPELITHNGEVISTGPAILSWATRVFHQVVSGPEGSLSMNFAVRDEHCGLDTEFNIYDLDTKTGKHEVIRAGFKDQKQL